MTDVEGLDAKAGECRDLDASIRTKDAEMRSLETEIAALAGASDALRESSERAKECHAALGGVPLESFLGEIATLGADPTASLRRSQHQLSTDRETARAAVSEARTALSLAEERGQVSALARDAAVVAKDAALTTFPDGLAATLANARLSLEAAAAEQQPVTRELESLETRIAEEAARTEAAVIEARKVVEAGRVRVEAAEAASKKALTEHASHEGRLAELQRLRAAEDLPAAEKRLREATVAQASNLGQTLAPAIAGRFEALTAQRYQNVRLTPELSTEGVVVGGTLRPTGRISVGTREQLSTLYRLALAEYLQTTVVLDDQLVQSDDMRMDWFRGLLAEKARSFQIIVFTCRPADYLAPDAMVPSGTSVHADSDAGFIRAVDLRRAVK